MAENRFERVLKLQLKRIFQYFLQGLVVLIPISLTGWVIISIFNAINGIFPAVLNYLFPTVFQKESVGWLQNIPGIGFVLVIAFVILIGLLSSGFIFRKLMEGIENILEKTPGIKLIYGSVKDVMEAFSGNKKKFDQPVLVSVDAEGVWRLGFITNNDAIDFGLSDYVVVYVPLSYAINGITYFVPKHKIKPLKNLSSTEAMKFALSGGVVEVDN